MHDAAVRALGGGNIQLQFHFIEYSLKIGGRYCTNDQTAFVADNVRLAATAVENAIQQRQ